MVNRLNAVFYASPELNPVLDDILRKQGDLQEKYIKLQNKMMDYKQPGFKFLRWHNKEIEKEIVIFKESFELLDLEYDEWLSKADRFRQAPSATIVGIDSIYLASAILHCSNVVRDKIEHMERIRYYIMLSINKIRSDYDSKVSFRIAVFSWRITFVGLIASIYFSLASVYHWWPFL